MKFEITDENGTVLACELFEGRVRILTDADRLPQGHPVWLTGKELEELIIELSGMWFAALKGDVSGTHPSRDCRQL